MTDAGEDPVNVVDGAEDPVDIDDITEEPVDIDNVKKEPIEVDAVIEMPVPVEEDEAHPPIRDEAKEASVEEERPEPVQESVQAPIYNQAKAPIYEVAVTIPIYDAVPEPANVPKVPIYNYASSNNANGDSIKVPRDEKPQSESESTSSSPSKTSLLIPLLNIFGYLLNLSISYLGSTAGWFSGQSFSEISSRYQTLLTPAPIYFVYIWGIIFLFQGFFVAAQLLPRYKHHILVTEGVGIWYFLVCCAQCGWSVAFGFEFMIAAFASMVAILLCLLNILNRQWTIIGEAERKKEEDPWLLANNAVSVVKEAERDAVTAPAPSLGHLLMRFPFAVHAGWIAPATPLMLSVAMIPMNPGTQVELWTAVLGLAMLFGMSMGLLLRQDKGAPSYVVPAVVAYACIGIMWELDAPADSILGRFQDSEISLVKNVAGFCGVMLLVTAVSRFFAIMIRDCCCNKKYDEEEEEDVVYIHADDV